MATGSGKTITSILGAYRLYGKRNPLLIVIAAPYTPLIEQWCGVAKQFGLDPKKLSTSKNSKLNSIQRIKRRLCNGVSAVEVIVVTHDTLCKPYFLNAIEDINCERLLIADEVHHLGRQNFVSNMPEFFEYRLGLSATPERQYDQEGTTALLDFFGSTVFQFTLDEAIGSCLVEYDYYIHPVMLNEDEMAKWHKITYKIKKNAWRNRDEDSSEYVKKLFRDRRALLETASSKITKLKELLDSSNELHHTLIYASDKGPKQLNEINHLLNKKHIMFHQITKNETRNPEQTSRIIKEFQDGNIQVLTAKRVLDEGMDIPQICQAFILASNTVERQWVQRRGRLLRKCSDIGKTYSIIHDLVVIPKTYESDSEANTMIKSELVRALEFAQLARNAGESNGANSDYIEIKGAVCY